MKKSLCHSLAIIAIASQAAHSADRPVHPSVAASSPPNDDWTGFYAGPQMGFGTGHSAWSGTLPVEVRNISGFTHGFDPFNRIGGYFGGFQAGYNQRLASALLFGLEADVSFPNLVSAGQGFTSPIAAVNYRDMVEMFATARGRLGYELNHYLFYATGGFAWTYDQFTRTQPTNSPGGAAPTGAVESSLLGRMGWAVGTGIEAPVTSGWTERLEYLYAQFGRSAVGFPIGGQNFRSDFSQHEVRLALNYRLDDGSKTSDTTIPPPLEVSGWAVHGQTTFLSQYALPFHAPYRGANSLDPNAGRESWDATLYIGKSGRRQLSL